MARREAKIAKEIEKQQEAKYVTREEYNFTQEDVEIIQNHFKLLNTISTELYNTANEEESCDILKDCIKARDFVHKPLSAVMEMLTTGLVEMIIYGSELQSKHALTCLLLINSFTKLIYDKTEDDKKLTLNMDVLKLALVLSMSIFKFSNVMFGYNLSRYDNKTNTMGEKYRAVVTKIMEDELLMQQIGQ